MGNLVAQLKQMRLLLRDDFWSCENAQWRMCRLLSGAMESGATIQELCEWTQLHPATVQKMINEFRNG